MSQIVAVTGGGGALGSAVVRALVARGHRAAILDTEHGAARGAALAEELGADKVLVHRGDFSTADAWTAALATIRGSFGDVPSLAALIAGGWAGGAALHEAKDDSAYTTMMKANVDTVYQALRALLPPMVNARRGSIVVVGSRAVERPWTSAGSAAYAASKAAVVTLAQTTAEEVLAHGVRINAVLPSTLDTPANRAGAPEADPSRWVSVDSAASVIAFLLSDDARDVSGAALPLYGRA